MKHLKTFENFQILPIDKEFSDFILDYKQIEINGLIFKFLFLNDNSIVIENNSDGEIGKASLNSEGYLNNIRIDSKYRRIGLATKIYEYIEELIGKKLKPSPIKQSQEIKKFWDKRNLKESITNKKNSDFELEFLTFDKTQKSENFYKWFGNSEMVDNENNPLIFYHGSKNRFTKFDDRKKGSATDPGLRGRGFYFSTSKGTSQSYGDNLLEVYLKIEKIFDLLSFDSIQDIANYLEIDESIIFDSGDINKGYPWYSVKVYTPYSGVFTSAIRDKGYDGIKHGIEFVVFEPNQIKAIDNDGSFDINDEDIFS